MSDLGNLVVRHVHVVKSYSGRELDRLRRYGTATEKTMAAVELREGTASIVRPTQRQTCDWTGANHTYVSALSECSAEAREAVASGALKLADLAAGKKSAAREANDTQVDELDSLIDKVGVERLYAALDRATAPVKEAAE